MSLVAFFTFPDIGHLNPTFRLAKGLQREGHRVIYLGIRDAADRIAAEGFECITFCEDLLPQGSYHEQLHLSANVSGWRTLLVWRGVAQVMKQVFSRVLEGELNSRLLRLKPDLFVFDNLLPQGGVVAHGLGLRPVQLDTNVPWRKERRVPPHFSPLIPDDGIRTRIASEFYYRRRRAYLRIRAGSGTMFDDFGSVREFARKFDFPLEKIDFDGAFPSLRVPELVMCPREFVEMGSPYVRGDYHFLEPGIDLGRKEPDFPWEELDPNKELVFCSLGSLPFLWPGYADFFRKVIEATARRKSTQVVMAVGAHADPDAFRAPHVVPVRFAPQLKLLERAKVAIIHGGFNTVKECIYFGVPMMVFPFATDQPGNAARVVYHGLGTRGDNEAVTVEAIARDLDRLLLDGPHKEKIRQMSKRFQQAENASPSVSTLLQLMEGRPQVGSATGPFHGSSAPVV